MRQTDVLARVGGDEFAVLLPQTGAEQAQAVADGIVKTLHQHVAVLGDRSIRVTASVGVVLFDGLSAAELLAYADLAMYEAKAAGRDRFTMYRPPRGRKRRASARLEEAERIRKALEEDRLLLYYQPILDLQENEIRQYELLLRLPNDQGGEPLPPSTFLYVAERCGLIQAIDCWVAAKAIAMIAEHQRAGRKLVLHVNLSGKSIGDSKVMALTEDALARTGIDPACLIFEVTETAAIANIEEAKAFAQRLRARGCQFALDDFGSGFGSFYYLKTLPFDYLKIDGDFIRGIVASPMDQLVVKAIVGIARGLGKKTIAEFVADEDTAPPPPAERRRLRAGLPRGAASTPVGLPAACVGLRLPTNIRQRETESRKVNLEIVKQWMQRSGGEIQGLGYVRSARGGDEASASRVWKRFGWRDGLADDRGYVVILRGTSGEAPHGKTQAVNDVMRCLDRGES